MPLRNCTLKSLTACRLGTQHNDTYPLNYAALRKELPWDISFRHKSLAYWIEPANIIPHYAARNLLDSTGILVLSSQTIGLRARSIWAGRTDRDFWHLTNARLYLHTPCFPPNTPSCAKASHETLSQHDQRGLITVAGWVKLRIWPKKVTRSHLDDWAPRETYQRGLLRSWGGGWVDQGRCCPFKSLLCKRESNWQLHSPLSSN